MVMCGARSQYEVDCVCKKDNNKNLLKETENRFLELKIKGEDHFVQKRTTI